MKSYSSIAGDSRGSDDRSLWDPHAPVKSIDYIGSFALITNNICGPAMMSLPSLFRAAGILPTVAMILFVYFCSCLVGVFLAESIQNVPGNREFRKVLSGQRSKTSLHIKEGLFERCIVSARSRAVGTVQREMSLNLHVDQRVVSFTRIAKSAIAFVRTLASRRPFRVLDALRRLNLLAFANLSEMHTHAT